MNAPELERLLYDFYQISGMEVAVVDTKYRNIISNRCPGKNFCATVHKCPKCLDICIQSDRDHLFVAQQTKQLLTYICPFGIFEAIAPIVRNGNVIAFLFFAMGIEEREGCDEIPLAKLKEITESLDFEYVRKCIIEIPHYSRKTLEAYADLLVIMAAYIERNDLMSDNEQSVGYLIKSYIDKNLRGKITLSDLSWNLHCSTVTLTEHFKREFGMTIMQYVTQRRMKKAEQLLRGGSVSINEIARECGFPDVEYFSRTFKSIYGMSPSRWRREGKKMGEAE